MPPVTEVMPAPPMTESVTKQDWLAYAHSLNGKRATVTALDVEQWLKEQGAPLPSRRTLQAWAREARG